MKKIIVLLVIAMILLVSLAYAQDEDLTPANGFVFGIEKFLNAFGIVSDETIVAEELKQNIANEEQIVVLQEMADSGQITQEQLQQDSAGLEDNIEANNQEIMQIASADPTDGIDANDVASAIISIEASEPEVTTEDVSTISGVNVQELDNAVNLDISNIVADAQANGENINIATGEADSGSSSSGASGGESGSSGDGGGGGNGE